MFRSKDFKQYKATGSTDADIYKSTGSTSTDMPYRIDTFYFYRFVNSGSQFLSQVAFFCGNRKFDYRSQLSVKKLFGDLGTFCPAGDVRCYTTDTGSEGMVTLGCVA